MQPDPWSGIERPASDYSARRVDPQHPGDLFWARDIQGRVALLLSYEVGAATPEPRPELQGVEIVEPPEVNGRRAIVLVLKRQEDAEIFGQLCLDIIESTRKATSPAGVLRAFILRTWKWHRLLRGGASGRLGPEEQQGLVGELLVMERLLSSHPPSAVVSCWRGPLDEPKDFVIGDRALEVKARHLTKNVVRISSEHQLQRNVGQELFLVVVALGPAAAATPGAFTLDHLVQRVAARMGSEPASAAVFETRLSAAGYSSDHDYADVFWVQVALSAFRVADEFPRIEASDLPQGVCDVRYSLSLDPCLPFSVPVDAVLPGVSHE